MPDEQQPESPADGDETAIDPATPTPEAASDESDDDEEDAVAEQKAGTGRPGGQLFSVYGWLSTVLGLASVAAVVFGLITWSMHRDDVNERAYRSRALQTAASWTSVLINLNAENVEKGMQRLHDKTVGQLNGEFEAALQPYREVVQRIQSRSTGRIEAVAIGSFHRDGNGGTDSAGSTEQTPPGAGRTDPVMVIATSIAENVGGKPQTVHWALQLDVSDVDGQMLISRLRSIR
ncbi:MAG TPA: hypothetical protein VFR27_19535 [Mycobacterium sp.]|nr:hypothetical protein [Mycobacterium sp.]